MTTLYVTAIAITRKPLCLSLFLSVCLSVCLSHTHTHTHTHSLIRTHAHTHTHTRARAHTHTHTHAGTYARGYVRTHTHTHTARHAQTRQFKQSQNSNKDLEIVFFFYYPPFTVSTLGTNIPSIQNAQRQPSLSLLLQLLFYI